MEKRGETVLQIHINKEKKARLRALLRSSGMTLRGWLEIQIDKVLAKSTKNQEVNKPSNA